MDRRPEVEALLGRAGVAFAYLFGSQARGQARADSDYDVGVWYPAGLDVMERFRRNCSLQAELENVLGRPVDLVILNDARPPLQHEAILRGEVLFPKDPESIVRFEARIRQRCEDYAYSQRFFTSARRMRLGLE